MIGKSTRFSAEFFSTSCHPLDMATAVDPYEQHSKSMVKKVSCVHCLPHTRVGVPGLWYRRGPDRDRYASLGWRVGLGTGQVLLLSCGISRRWGRTRAVLGGCCTCLWPSPVLPGFWEVRLVLGSTLGGYVLEGCAVVLPCRYRVGRGMGWVMEAECGVVRN